MRLMRMSQDLSQGKIYKITNDYNDEVYVGSTCDTLIKRFSKHKRAHNQIDKFNKKLYILMRDIGTDRFRIELIENYPCEDKYQLRQRECFYIREIGTLNQLVAGRTHKEYYKENKEICKERSKIQEQKETTKEKRKQYRDTVKKELYKCECGCEITRGYLSAHLKLKKHLNFMNTKNLV